MILKIIIQEGTRTSPSNQSPVFANIFAHFYSVLAMIVYFFSPGRSLLFDSVDDEEHSLIQRYVVKLAGESKQSVSLPQNKPQLQFSWFF